MRAFSYNWNQYFILPGEAIYIIAAGLNFVSSWKNFSISNHEIIVDSFFLKKVVFLKALVHPVKEKCWSLNQWWNFNYSLSVPTWARSAPVYLSLNAKRVEQQPTTHSQISEWANMHTARELVNTQHTYIQAIIVDYTQRPYKNERNSLKRKTEERSSLSVDFAL